MGAPSALILFLPCKVPFCPVSLVDHLRKPAPTLRDAHASRFHRSLQLRQLAYQKPPRPKSQPDESTVEGHHLKADVIERADDIETGAVEQSRK